MSMHMYIWVINVKIPLFLFVSRNLFVVCACNGDIPLLGYSLVISHVFLGNLILHSLHPHSSL